jgi:hypothetical protein
VARLGLLCCLLALAVPGVAAAGERLSVRDAVLVAR